MRRLTKLTDVLLAVPAMLFGAVSLWYPFGRDQGLFYYAAREWLERGQVLYRDVWDQKSPVIYVIHALAIALFGEHVWGIRVLELFVAVPLISWLAARLATPRGSALGSGTFGASLLGVSVFYYGFFGFWDTAQCEIWVAVFALGALVAALRVEDAGRGAALAGALSALALFSKPPAAPFVPIALAAVLLRGQRERVLSRTAWRRFGAFALSGTAVGTAILAVFAAFGALLPMLDILVGANAVYLDQERAFHGAPGLLLYTVLALARLGPATTIFFVLFGASAFAVVALRDFARFGSYLTAAALVLASYLSVVMQMKFYWYHWGTLAAAAGLVSAGLYADMSALGRRRSEALAPVGFALLVATCFVTSGASATSYAGTLRATIRYVRGELGREDFTRIFDVPGFYSAHDAELTARWLRARAKADDTLVVRGFEPEIYAMSGLHYGGRFFWTAVLTMPTRVYRRAEWLAEDESWLDEHKPRWAVTLGRSGIDSAAWFLRHGYARRTKFGSLEILEAPRSSEPTPLRRAAR